MLTLFSPLSACSRAPTTLTRKKRAPLASFSWLLGESCPLWLAICCIRVFNRIWCTLPRAYAGGWLLLVVVRGCGFASGNCGFIILALKSAMSLTNSQGKSWQLGPNLNPKPKLILIDFLTSVHFRYFVYLISPLLHRISSISQLVVPTD